MSSFGGILVEQELSFLRIDNFENDISNGQVFLLSHFHADHYRGLFDEAFQKMINLNSEVFIYCTSITKNLMLARNNCKIQPEKILTMNLNSPYFFHCNNISVTITALPAGHCPGSAMFYIEFEGMRIVYTGDIRMSAKELRCYTALHDSEGILKPINTLYLDTTFCDPKWLVFPSRGQSLADIESTIASWLSKDQRRLVGILYNSYHGLEWVLQPIAKNTGTKIWILDEKAYNNYSGYPELSPFISREKETCKIHLCPVWSGSDCAVCNMYKEETLTIKPCAMSFDFDILQKKRFLQHDNNLLKVAYATHCSFIELTSVVRYLQPEIIIPCVTPAHLSIDQVMVNLCRNVDDHLMHILSKRTKLRAPYTGPGPSTSSLAQKPLSHKGESYDGISENLVETILNTAEYSSTLNFTCTRSKKINGNLVPYTIIWEEGTSSDPLVSQARSLKLSLTQESFGCKEDLPTNNTERVERHLVEKKTSPQFVNIESQKNIESRTNDDFLNGSEVLGERGDKTISETQVFAKTSLKESQSAQDENLWKFKRKGKNSSDAGVRDHKIIKMCATTEEQKGDDSSTDTDIIDLLDTPPY